MQKKCVPKNCDYDGSGNAGFCSIFMTAGYVEAECDPLHVITP
jgi:hypothetical protein